MAVILDFEQAAIVYKGLSPYIKKVALKEAGMEIPPMVASMIAANASKGAGSRFKRYAIGEPKRRKIGDKGPLRILNWPKSAGSLFASIAGELHPPKNVNAGYVSRFWSTRGHPNLIRKIKSVAGGIHIIAGTKHPYAWVHEYGNPGNKFPNPSGVAAPIPARPYLAPAYEHAFANNARRRIRKTILESVLRYLSV